MGNDYSDSTLIAAWRFEDGALTTDSKGSNTLSSSASPPTAETTLFKEGAASARFERTLDQYFYRASADLDEGFPGKANDTTKKATITCHILFDENYNVSWKNNTLWSKWTTGATATAFLFRYAYTGRLQLYWRTTTGQTLGITTSTALAGGRWYFVAVQLEDHGNNTITPRLYVYDEDADALFEDVTPSPVAGYLNVGTSTWEIGDRTSGSLRNHDGLIDELLVWKRILSDAELEDVRLGQFTRPVDLSGTITWSWTLTGNIASISLAPYYPLWTFPVRERLAGWTDVLAGDDGSEQRIARTIPPRPYFRTKLLLRTEAAIAECDAIFHTWLKEAWPVPVWPEAVLDHSTLSAGSSSIAIDTQYADFRDSSYGLIWQPGLQERIEISNVSSSSLSLAQNLTNTFTGSKWIMPLRQGYILGEPRRQRYAGGSALIEVEFAVTDNIRITGHTASMTYDGYDVLDTPAYVPGEYEQTDDPDAYLIDNKVGAVELVSHSDFNISTQSHIHHKTTKAECWAFRQWLHAVYARQKTFLVPTFRRDFELTAAVGPSDTTLTVVNQGYTNQMGVQSLRTYLGFWDGGTKTLIVRKIIGMSVISASVEQLTIDAAPGIAIPTTSAVCWVDRCRLAGDEIAIDWYTRNKLTASIPLVRVSA